MNTFNNGENKELIRRLKQAIKPKYMGYSVVLIVILAMCHIVDETSSNIANSIQSSIVNEFFVQGQGLTYAAGLSKLGILSILTLIVCCITPFYKVLADKYGRKPFLAMNIFGLVIGMGICFFSTNFPSYVVGMVITAFFLSHDMQVTYILEVAPPDKRAAFYGITKGIGTLGFIMLPVVRNLFMGDNPTRWRMIFLLPVIVGIVLTILILFGIRETDTFLEQRIKFLKQPEEERQKAKKNTEKVGIGVGFRYAFKNKQIRWILISLILTSIPMLAVSGYYQSIMHTAGMSTQDVTTALYIYPFTFGAVILICGFCADKLGRKLVSIMCTVISMTTYVLFIVGCFQGWSPIVVGFLYAIYLSCFWQGNDYKTIMINELAPTRIRYSVTGAMGLSVMVATLLGTTISAICVGIFELSKFCLGFTLPIMIVGTLIFIFKSEETKGIDMNEVMEI